MKRSFLILPICALILLGQGCTSAPVPLDGGIYRTQNNGLQWQQLKVFNLGTKLGSLADLGTVTLTTDPEDPLAIYAGTTENGLIYSLDGGDSWLPIKGFTIGRVTGVQVDPKNKCTVYAAKANQILKTTNCHRDWNQIFFDSRIDKVVTALTIDWYNPRTLYAGTSEGDLLRSLDAGTTWQAIQRVDGIRINNIALDPRDSRKIYVATGGAGILKSTDGGNSWDKIDKPFLEFENARRPTAVIIDPLITGRIYTISKYGILKSEDAGTTWKPLTLPSPASSVDIRALAIHPKNSRTIVYATDASLVFSTNDGATWTSKKSPTTRGASSLLFGIGNEPALYLGAAPKKTN